MYVYISFYQELLTDKVARKAIHVVDNPVNMFEILQKNINEKQPSWGFHAYQLNLIPQDLFSLYVGFYNSDNPPVIRENVITYFHANTMINKRLKEVI